MTEERHITSEEVAGFVDNTLSEVERARLRAHLADCDICREEVVSVSQLIEQAPRSRRRYIAFPAIAAAAAVVLILVVPRSRNPDVSETEPLRGPSSSAASEGVTAVRAIAPIGPQTSRDGRVFVWHPASPGSAYRLTLTDEQGEKLWVGSTNDTTLAIPPGTLLLPDRSYHWYVDAVQSDGSAATTGIISFQVSR